LPHYDELNGTYHNYTRITHVLIDDILTERVVHVGFGEIFYMTDKSYEKFSYQPFELIYRNFTINPDTLEESWAEIYEINWDYIEKSASFGPGISSAVRDKG